MKKLAQLKKAALRLRPILALLILGACDIELAECMDGCDQIYDDCVLEATECTEECATISLMDQRILCLFDCSFAQTECFAPIGDCQNACIAEAQEELP